MGETPLRRSSRHKKSSMKSKVVYPERNLDSLNIQPTLLRDCSPISIKPVALPSSIGAECFEGAEIRRDCVQINPKRSIAVSNTRETVKKPLLIRGEGVEVRKIITKK